MSIHNNGLLDELNSKEVIDSELFFLSRMRERKAHQKTNFFDLVGSVMFL